MYGVSLLALVGTQDVLQYDAIAEQLTGVDKLLLVSGGFPRVHLGQVSLEPPNRPGGFAFDRLIVELLIRGFDYQRNIHDATLSCPLLEDTADRPDQTRPSRVSVCGGL